MTINIKRFSFMENIKVKDFQDEIITFLCIQNCIIITYSVYWRLIN